MIRSRLAGWLLRVLSSLYRVLLVAYPKEFRRAYREQMAQVFGDLCAKELRRGGIVGLLVLWIRTLADLIVTAGVERAKMRGVSALMERWQEALSQNRVGRFFTFALLTGIPFGGFMVLYQTLTSDYPIARNIVTGGSGGIVFGLLMAAFAVRQNRVFATHDPTSPGEELLRRGGATHWAAGGQLYLTNERLVFVSHKYNLFLNHKLSIPLEEVTSIRPRQTMGFIPNGVEVIWGDKKERFIVQVQDRQEWIGELQQRLSEDKS